MARLLALTLVTVGLISVAGARFLGQKMESEAAGRLQESALRVRESLEAYLEQHGSAIATLAALGRPQAGSARLEPRTLEECLRIYPGFLSLLVTDAEGRLVQALRRDGTLPRAAGRGASVADRDYFQQAKQSRKTFVSGVFEGRGLGQERIAAISAPVLNETGEVVGVVEGSIDLRRIPLGTSNPKGSLAVVAIDAAGRIVYSTAPHRYRPLDLWARGKAGPPAGELAAEYPVRSAGWRVVATRAMAEVQQEAHEFYWTAAWALLAMSVFTWMMAQLMAEAIAGPIVRMVREMQRYELEAPRAETSGRSRAKSFVALELAQIDGEFERLRGRLEEGFRQLRRALAERDETNRRLQDVLRDRDEEVKARTAQWAESEIRYRQVVENAGDLILRTDPKGQVTFHNAACVRLLGEDLLGSNLFARVDAATQKTIRQRVRQQLREREPAIYLEFPFEYPDGEPRWIGQSNQLLLDERGRVTGFQAIARDITVQKAAETALREAEERYALAVKGSNNGIWDWDLRTGRVYYSERWKQMLGWEAETPCESLEDWWARVHPGDLRMLRVELDAYVHAGDGLFEREHRVRHADGTWRWVLTCGAAVRSAEGEALRIAGSTTDITDGKLVDALTGLPNRLSIVERLDRLVGRRREEPGREFALLFMDLDRFKLINDSLGHLKGDHLLLGVSRRLLSALESRPGVNGCVGRLGGDEFVIVVDDAPVPEVAVGVAQAVLEEMRAPFHIDGALIFASTSIGVAHSATGLRNTEDALRNADTAMYQAKAEGHGKYRLFDASMHARAVNRLELETDLRHALEACEFVLHYQPQICLTSGDLAGFEALVRWQHPQRGLLQPGEFIRIAEEIGLILPLGRWVLENSCRQMATWDRLFPPAQKLTMSVNLSALQFSDPGLTASVARALAETGLAPERLHLEVTESMVADDPAEAQAILRELSKMGVRLEVDDFGTGYSCLSQLHQLPFDTLKVDRSFVQAMDLEQKEDGDEESRRGGRKVVESIVTLSANLGIRVIAEGIETQEHWTQLATMGCAVGQGYYFSRPIDAEQALRLVELRAREPWPLPEALRASAEGLVHLRGRLAGSPAGDGAFDLGPDAGARIDDLEVARVGQGDQLGVL